MGTLIKPADYAKQLGISRQAVYAKIKKGILASKSVDGKLYIVQQERDPILSSSTTDDRTPFRSFRPSLLGANDDLQDLLEAKNETIRVLRETIADLKETNRMITSTLQRELEMLKEAFAEMKKLYAQKNEANL